MKIQVQKHCRLKDLPDILKNPVLLNLEKFKIIQPSHFSGAKLDLNNCDICDFEWSKSIESKQLNFKPDYWNDLYEGEEVDIPENVIQYWESLIEPSIKIEVQGDKIYYATSNNKKFKITIEEVKDDI